MRSRSYGDDVLAGSPVGRAEPAECAAERDLVVEDLDTGFVGAVVEVQRDGVSLEDRFGAVRFFPYGLFRVEADVVRLVRPRAAGPVRPARTASGSIAPVASRARVARGSRIYVEGRHDAELVEKVWGDDLRVEGVVVEYLEGIDDLPDIVRSFAPGADRRLGVLVDHLVPGSKESRIAAAVTSPHVLIVGHPYVDIWQAVRPAALGIRAWPAVPRNVAWKDGICAALGVPDSRTMWRRVLGSVRDYTDLETPLLTSVEQLIDFVTEPGAR